MPMVRKCASQRLIGAKAVPSSRAELVHAERLSTITRRQSSGSMDFDERLIVLVVDVADNMIESIPANDVEVLFHHLPARRLTVTVADLAQTFLQGAAVHLAVEVDDNIADATAPRLQVLTARN